jgi:hypothetical protein
VRFYQETMFIRECKRYVKEGSGRGNSLHWSPVQEPEGGFV